MLANEGGQRSFLEVSELSGMNLSNTALVTLSACESGLGRVDRGDEVQGFPRGFLMAGSSALIASLWPVSDNAAELLMRTLYSQLARGTDLQRAMQAGQLAVLHQPRTAHPFFWAPFNLIGNWRLTVGE
ncbi:CHAT domain protein [compost metagenome]